MRHVPDVRISQRNISNSVREVNVRNLGRQCANHGLQISWQTLFTARVPVLQGLTVQGVEELLELRWSISVGRVG